MIDVDPTLSYPKVVFLSTVAIAIGTINLVETVRVWDAALRYPVVEGDVTARKEFRHWGGIPAGRLTIRVVGVPDVVQAEVPRYLLDRLPNRVRFRYSGDPKTEVFIFGETHPAWLVLLTWGLAAALILFYVKQQSPRGG